jgi:hypothetical protein
VTDKPLVSVITGTRDRLDDIKACIQRVRDQVYRPLEHVVVSDGPDLVLREYIRTIPSSDVRLIFQETGRVWSDEFEASPGAAAFQVAQLLGTGTLQMWLSDDEEMDPDHIDLLVKLLEQTNSDFVYSKAIWYTAPHIQPPLSYIIGTCPPRPDQLTNCLYRTALLDYAKFETHMGRGTDWYQVHNWIEAGARYKFLNHVTFRHRADQVGGAYDNHTKQPLRGHATLVEAR